MIVWEINPKNFEAVAKKAVLALQKGKVLVCPTDTVYGLIADAANKRAVQRIFRIKGREKGKPIPIFVSDIEMARTLAEISKIQERFCRKVWPGKVTVVLESKNKLPRELGTVKTIGLRIPNYKLVKLILGKVRRPLTATSANLSGTPSLSDSKEIIAQFSPFGGSPAGRQKEHAPDILIDAGVLPKSKPSKIIDITETKHKVIRK